MPIQKERACKATAYKNIAYIIDPGKTVDDDMVIWVDTQNMKTDGNGEAKDFAREFREVNKMFKQNKSYDDRKYYHIIINFKGIPDVTPKMAMEIAKAYLKRFYPNHQAVIAVHLRGGREDPELEGEEDEGIHVHACINSVDMMTGKKVERSWEELGERKDMVNTLANEMYGIAPFDWRAAVKKKRQQQRAEKMTGEPDRYSQAEKDMQASGRTSELDELRIRILRNAMMSKSREEFEERMRSDGVTMPRNTENTVSFKYKEGTTGTVRGSRLGDRYTAEFIDSMIEYNRLTARDRRDPETYAPLMNFDHIDEIADRKNYALAQSYGIDTPKEKFICLPYSVLAIRVAYGFVIRQNTCGIGFKNGRVYFDGQPVRTDVRLQRMYNVASAAQKCMNEHGCDRPQTLEKKKEELQERLTETKVELRKERKIETAYKKRLSQKRELLDALSIVCEGAGSTDEQNQARRQLYRKGIKKDEFGDSETKIRLLKELKMAEEELARQSEKTKDIYYKQRDIEKDIAKIGKVLNGLAEVNNPKFYYGNDPNWQQSIANDIDDFERKKAEKERKKLDKGWEGNPLENLLEEAQNRSDALEVKKQEMDKEETKKPHST